MPSGPKKRKAARRKKELRAHHPTDSPPHVPGDGSPRRRGKEADSSSSSGSSDHPVTDEEPEEIRRPTDNSSGSAPMEGADNGKRDAPLTIPDLEVLVVKEEMLDVDEAVPVFAEVVRVEFVEAAEKEGKSGGDAQEEQLPVAVGPTEVAAALPVSEEVVQAAEVHAVDVEASVAPAGTPPQEAEGKVAPPPPPEAGAEKPREVAVTTEATRVVQLRPHATWWNCCGLLDAFTSSDR